jgi:hypothetical protein
MAPDLEKLIRSIDALGRQLCNELSLSIPHRDAAEAIVARTSDTRAMLHQLASFSRGQARPVRAIDLNDVITRSEATLTRLCGGEVDLQVRLTPVGHVVAVEEEVEQLVASLVFNARELLTAGGSLALSTTAVHDGVTETSREDVDRRAASGVRLAVTATAYGVLPAVVSPALDLLARRCGGEITRQGEPGRMAGYSLDFPSMH